MRRCDSASVGAIWFKGHAVRSVSLTPRVFLGLQQAGPHSVVLYSSSRKDLLSTRPQGPVGNVADTKWRLRRDQVLSHECPVFTPEASGQP